jgi:hypothetical protein
MSKVEEEKKIGNIWFYKVLSTKRPVWKRDLALAVMGCNRQYEYRVE